MMLFEGRKPGEEPDQYFGYRHAMYFIKYNRTHRLDIFKYCNWGDCNWQAYADYLGDEIDREVANRIKAKC